MKTIVHLTVLLGLGLAPFALPACTDPDEDVFEAPEVMLRQRPFTAPGQISQGLGANGRALIFIVRESLPGRPAVEYDAAWTFDESWERGTFATPTKLSVTPS